MVKAQKTKKESSSEASSSSKCSKPQNVLFLSDKEKAKLEGLAREDNIANSMKEMGKSAIKASNTHTQVSDELAANEARYLQLQQERERNRVRLEVLQEQTDNRSDLEDQELKDLSAWMKETNDLQSLIPQSDEDGSSLRPQTEEEEEINPSQTEEDDDKIGTKTSPKEILSDDDNVSVTDNASEEAEEEQTNDEEEEGDNDNDDFKSKSDEEEQSESGAEDPPSPKPKKKKSMPLKPLATTSEAKPSLPSKMKTNPNVLSDPKCQKPR